MRKLYILLNKKIKTVSLYTSSLIFYNLLELLNRFRRTLYNNETLNLFMLVLFFSCGTIVASYRYININKQKHYIHLASLWYIIFCRYTHFPSSYLRPIYIYHVSGKYPFWCKTLNLLENAPKLIGQNTQQTHQTSEW